MEIIAVEDAGYGTALGFCWAHVPRIANLRQA